MCPPSPLSLISASAFLQLSHIHIHEAERSLLEAIALLATSIVCVPLVVSKIPGADWVWMTGPLPWSCLYCTSPFAPHLPACTMSYGLYTTPPVTPSTNATPVSAHLQVATLCWAAF